MGPGQPQHLDSTLVEGISRHGKEIKKQGKFLLFIVT